MSLYLKIKNYKIKNYKIKNCKLKGQSLVELLVAIAVGVILIGSSAVLMGISMKSYGAMKQHLQASVLIRQTAEVVQSLTRSNWRSIYDLTPGIHYKTVKRGNTYVFQKGEEKIFDSQNLVSYWSFDEATSTIAYDSQSTNNGTLTNSPTWQAESNCVSGSCLSFDGSDDYVNCGNGANLDVENAATIGAWIKPVVNKRVGLVGRSSGGSWTDGRLYLITQATTFEFGLVLANGTSSQQVFGTTQPIVNTWYHVVATFDGSRIKIYINGVLEKNEVQNFIPEMTGYDLIMGYWSGLGYFNGLIDEPRIYSRALSADEIKTHYKAGLDKLGLVGYWAMDENGGTLAYDNQSTNNGTLTNGPTWQSESNCVSGSCLSFDGTDDYVSIPGNTSLDTPNALTVEAWIYDKVSNISHSINKDGATRIWIIRRETDSSVNWHVWNSDGSLKTFTPVNSWAMNQWFHIACTAKVVGANIEMEVFFNGVSKGTTSFAGTAIQVGTTIPVRFGVNGGYKNQYLDQVRIYNRALSADEIAQRYQASYTKYFVTNKVSRTSGIIDTTYSSANDDPSTLKINSVVKYGRGLVSQQTGGIADVKFYLTRSEDNKVLHQTDWSGGSGQTGPISNPGNKFDTADSNINYASTTGQITMTTATTTPATLVSSILDTGVSGGAGFNSLLWQGSLGTDGTVKFQIAFSNSSSTVNTYYGPTSTSDYYQPNPNVSVAFPTTGSASPQNKRYIRYKVYLSTSSTTPQINDIIINWSP